MFRVVDLPGTIFLVPSRKLDELLRRQARDHKGIPAGVGQVVADLALRRDGVPATVDEPRDAQGDRSLLLYTTAYVVRLFPTPYQDAYTVAAVAPIRLRDHDRIARGALLVRAGWQAAADFHRLPAGARSYWPELAEHWYRHIAAQGDSHAVPALAAAHARFLDTLDTVIDATQRIELARRSTAPSYPYRAVDSAGERRYGAAPVYTFQVVGDALPDRGAFVQVQGEPEQRGQVVRVDEDRVIVRFDQPVSWERLAAQGELVVAESNVVHEKRRKAVDLLRTRQTRNRTLLSVLVDHRVQPVRDVADQPAQDLDRDQLTAFRKALGTRDMLLVLGPPGTGKTRTISQIARAYAMDQTRGRVLVASHTNRAVDNVLANLPRDMVVVRVGNEGKVDPDGRPYLLERQAADLRSEILAATGPALRAYEHVDLAARWADELGRGLGLLTEALGEEARARSELDQARRAVGGPAQAAVDALAAELAKHEHRLARRQRGLDRLTRRAARMRDHADWPVLGPVFAALVRLPEGKAAARGTELDELRHHGSELRVRLADAEHILDAATSEIPAVRAAHGAVRAAVRECDERQAAVLHSAGMCTAILRPMVAPPPVRTDGDRAAVVDDLTELHAWLGPTLSLLATRARILTDWHRDVSGATEQLHPELIRYADVIGATCIGAASRDEIAEVDFDVAIIDEAGQIGVADVLVPLVRAERAVLVGDHRQLPPFLDTEVEAWGAVNGDPAVRTLLSRSALEILVDALPAGHVVPLTRQRRMPKVVADFISAAFYDGTLTTMVERTHDDLLFDSALAFVDTTRLARSKRAELPAARRYSRAQGGYVNLAEAKLLSRLATHYHRLGAEWAVIVPYGAQVKLVAEYLRGTMPDSDTVESNVGTVDSFQGGERDVILYGFTRSNAEGSVGFLDELRRANVAFSRVKHQLVLVGDMSMLLRAKDDGFRVLATALRDHVAADGDVRQYDEVVAWLDEHESGVRTR